IPQVGWQAVARGQARRLVPNFSPRCTAPSQAASNGRWAFRGLNMRTLSTGSLLASLLAVATFAAAQGDYKVISVTDGGTISGAIKWSGAVPHELDFPVTKDPQICAPDGSKTVSLERLIVGPEGGVANTIVYLKNISAGKALELPEQRRHLDQK